MYMYVYCVFACVQLNFVNITTWERQRGWEGAL